MFTFLQKIFRKNAEPVPVAAVSPSVKVRVAGPRVVSAAPGAPRLEMAHLSLAAILEKLPDDLKRTVTLIPDPSVTIALPLATIHKQLPGGSVKMSLASLYRQAPAGVFSIDGRQEEKRMIEVPLKEIFRHVKPAGLQRRTDQRRFEVPRDAIEVFGDRENPRAVAPRVPDPLLDEAVEPECEAPASEPSLPMPPGDLRLSAAPAGGEIAAASVPSLFNGQGDGQAGGVEMLAVALADLCGAWPEPIRGEALALGAVEVSLPTTAIAAGLARGKVAFSWEQIRVWLGQAGAASTEAKEATELILPLKVIAPAFLASSRKGVRRKSFQVDDSIPALFTGGPPMARDAAPPAPAGERAALPAPDAALPHTQNGSSESHAVSRGIAGPSIPPASTAELPAALVEPPLAEEAPLAPVRAAAPISIGELVGKPEKEHWSPQELLDVATALPGVKGAVIALQEGLLVAAKLPEPLKGDVMAAFLPQIFARMGSYIGEMKLGEVDEVLFTTRNSHFQAYRLGELYFGVLGNPDAALPWDGLRLIADHLAQHSP